MAFTTAVPPPTFGPTGFIAPTEASILAGVQADQNLAFGGNLNLGLNTPQGQLAQSLTAIIGDCNNQFLALTQGVDPSYASGRMQDAIGRIYFMTRNPAQSTVVTATCVGLFGTVIPIGAKAQDQGGNIYLCTQTGAIPASGTVDLTFAAQSTGPLACPAGYLNAIYQAIPGWDRVGNASAGVLGNVVESRSDFEYRRAASVALNAQGSLPSVLGAVFQVPGVLDAYVTENVTPVSANVGGITLVPNSIYVCVYGGNATAVAQAIWNKKSPGCNYTGNTTVYIQDSSSGYSAPYPTYPVTFQTPTATPVLFNVAMQNNANVPANAIALIQAAITAAFTGTDGGSRARIGSTLFASRFYAGIASLGPWAFIYSVQIGLTSAVNNSITMGIGQVPTISSANISVVFR
jgi:hypothetical protein